MTRLSWAAVAERFYETGVDRGVLYVDNIPGVAWTGLTSVSESPSGGEPKAYYIDGVKYLNISSAEEFEATISALAAPPEFGPCDGTVSVHNGLFVTQQPRKSFGLSYRTKIGNDIDGSDYGYKIHLVYNALAAPSERSNNTIGDSTDPLGLSWSITTMAPTMTGYKPTAHFVIDSRMTLGGLMKTVEDILYGSESASPRLLSAQELIDMFMSQGPVQWRNLVTNPQFEDTPTTVATRRNLMPNPSVTNDAQFWGTFGGSGARSTAVGGQYGSSAFLVTATGGGAYGGYGDTLAASVVAGEPIYGSVYMYVTKPTTVQIAVEFKDASSVKINTVTGPTVTVPANAWTRVSGYGGLAPANTNRVTVTCYTTASHGPATAGDLMYLDAMLIEKASLLDGYFDGSWSPNGEITYRWVGTPYLSVSERMLPVATGQNGTVSDAYSWHWWTEGAVGSRYGRWRAKGGTPTATWRVARSTALSRNNIVAGQKYTLMGRMRRSGWTAGSVPIRLSNSNGTNEIMPAASVLNVGSDWVDFRIVFTALINGSTDVNIGFYASLPNLPPATEHGYFDLDYWAIIEGDYQGPYFDGNTPDAAPVFYNWEGAQNASTSVVQTWDF